MGAELYPPANATVQWFEGRFGGSRMDVNVACVHTTETTGWPGYGGGAMAPNVTGRPRIRGRRLDWRQHFRANTSSRALRNLTGGVETNTLNVFQLELVGTCDESKRSRWGTQRAGVDYIFWPDPPDWALRDVADLLRWLHADHDVPLVAPSLWLAYGPDPRRPGIAPASYGKESPARMTGAQWRRFTGVCGHQHVPENVHGDPGAFPIDRVLALAKGGDPAPTPAPTPTPAPAPQPGDDDMPMQRYQVKGRAPQYVVTPEGLVHIANAAVCKRLVDEGRVSRSITYITAAELAALQKG